MNLQKNKIEIDCPYCNFTFSKGTDEVKCPVCKTTIDLDKNGRIIDYSIPEFHNTTLVILSIVSFILLVIILIDAVLSENTSDKLVPIGVVLVCGLIAHLTAPFVTVFSRRYSRFGTMIAITLVLLLFLILNIGGIINYS